MIKILGVALLGIASASTACGIGAKTLFDKTIPRQDVLRVDINEMADMKKWEEYKKIIVPNREWLTAQNLEHITIKSFDGLTLHADYFPAETESNKLVICNHGYTGSGISNCSSISVFFHKLGYDCLIVDHRAHGKSEGDYVGFGILDRYDCREWIKYIDKRFHNSKKIVLYGVSMGATTSLMTAGFKDLSASVKAIVSDCAFTSPYNVFAHILKRDYHLMPFPIMNINDMMCRKKAGYGFSDYSTIDAVKNTKIPILFIHGKEDDFVPLYMTKQNYEACNSPKDIYIVENAGHGAAYYENPLVCEEKIKSFLDKYIR
ncbi:MAG: alpha/beta hydrolase [Oscillospiraceae bacterium]|nr:alpha/beta hydrolase [Oscillospiraceae bacterium]